MRSLLLELDLSPGVGRRAAVEQALRSAIRSGQLHEGTRLPSTRSLADDLGLARATVVAAYEQLVAEGYLIATYGSGTSVGSVHQAPPSSLPRRSVAQGGLRLDFIPGEPDRSSFPRRAWLSAVNEALKLSPDELFGYGDTRGRHELRISLTDYLSRTRAVVVEPERVSIFGGFTNSLSFLAETFRRLGIDRIGIEDPGMPFHARLLTDAGLTVVPIAVDEDGISVVHLAAEKLRAVLVTPAHEYPLGMAMSSNRRVALLAWARSNAAWIVEDDYDGEFRYDRQPLGALQGLGSDRVIYAGTVSKSLAAGLRIGWLVLPAELVETVAYVKGRRGGVSNLDQATLSRLIDDGGLDRHVARMRRVYRQRQEYLLDALRDSVPWFDVTGIAAGLHVTAYLSEGAIGEAQLVDFASRRSFALWGLGQHRFSAGRGDAGIDREGIVLGFSRSTDRAFPAAVGELVALLRDARRSLNNMDVNGTSD